MSSVFEKLFSVLRKPEVSEIVCNGFDSVYVKINGSYSLVQGVFTSKEHYEQSVRTELPLFVKSPYGMEDYLFEGPLELKEPDGSKIKARCTVVLPPAASEPQVVVAKKTTVLTTLDGIQKTGSFNAEVLDVLKAIVKSKMTVVILGSTGAGKTTMLEALCREVDGDVRIGVAEDTPELTLIQKNVTYLNSVPWKPGFDPNNVASLSWVVQQFQRMRVERLIVGETRGKEFADFLTSANSGVEGSMTTLHASSPRQGLMKMSSFAMKGEPGRSLHSINTEIANAVDIILQLKRYGAKHKLDEVTEVSKVVSPDSDALITTSTLYKYNPEKDLIERMNNPTDSFVSSLKAAGIDPKAVVRSPLARAY